MHLGLKKRKKEGNWIAKIALQTKTFRRSMGVEYIIKYEKQIPTKKYMYYMYL